MRAGARLPGPRPGGAAGQPPTSQDHEFTLSGKTKPVGGINLEQIFSSSGFDCGAKGTADIKSYGFVPLGSSCGKTN